MHSKVSHTYTHNNVNIRDWSKQNYTIAIQKVRGLESMQVHDGCRRKKAEIPTFNAEIIILLPSDLCCCYLEVYWYSNSCSFTSNLSLFSGHLLFQSLSLVFFTVPNNPGEEGFEGAHLGSFRNPCMALQLYAGPVDIPRPTNYTHKDKSLET